MPPFPALGAAAFVLGSALAAGLPAPSALAAGEALLLVEADSGRVLKAENATYPWYPASVTKLMTAYVTLKAVKAGRIALDAVLRVSPTAAAQQPTKMGFGVGTQVTVDNALKMLMVKSANDMAVVLAEGVSGSVERFADEMNTASARLGMVQSRWVNPNGLPADDQITSARDMAILARAILTEFPEYDSYWNIQAIRLGKRVMRNTNSLIVRYPGADGMKTGFICASGFNVVATATRNNRRLIAVVLGAPSSGVRAAKAAHMFETAFNGVGLSWLSPSLGRVEHLQPVAVDPPNLRDAMCGKHRRRPAAEEADEEEAGLGSGADGPGSVSLFSAARIIGPRPSSLLADTVPLAPPVVVYVGPPRAIPEVATATPDNPPTAIKRKKPAAPPTIMMDRPARLEAGVQGATAPRLRPAAPKPTNATAAPAKPASATAPARPGSPAAPTAAGNPAKPAAPAPSTAAGKPAKPAAPALSTPPGKPAKPPATASADKPAKPPAQ